MNDEQRFKVKVGCDAYLAEGEQPGGRDEGKQVFGRARLLAPAPDAIPDYWRRVSDFVLTDLPNWDFRKPSAWDQAWAQAWVQAQAQAWAQAQGQARVRAWVQADEVALYCCVECLCADLPIAAEHRQFAQSLRDHYVTEV